MVFDKIYLKNKLKGSSAEEIFLMLHLELGCQVYRTGHEFLYPHLFQIANKQRKKHHKVFKEDDAWSFPLSTESEARAKVSQRRFANTEWGTNISSSPDFTILTPQGVILQFEVKFRKDGELRPDELEKYASLKPAPFLFIVMAKKPYIKILVPGVYQVKPSEEVLKKILDKEGNLPSLPNSEAISKLIICKIQEGKLSKKDIEELRNSLDRLKDTEGTYTENIEKNKRGDMRLVLGTGLPSDFLVYSGEILEKYRWLIKEHYNEN